MQADLGIIAEQLIQDCRYLPVFPFDAACVGHQIQNCVARKDEICR